ncbi:hypothetical protein E4J89_11025 [Arthrobacter sp. CAU 1506]|uniref:ABC transporter substrate-binding protein n=1 Tax=Arthrobacter sp. CAU 1506 TaxID=2560052 RepID=UPI0010AC9108|nr:ABC transporter substrate-binding protein [Arthrobacter sp. CAU 1506]TJY69447.1 hypothetical protein E4J89_11025 [Arthrobacter sp. CAU 1506]
MTLRQSHFVPPVPYLFAAHHGLLAGLDVEATRATSSAVQLEGLLTGDLDLAVTAIDNLFEWTRAGADLRLVAQVERTTPLGIYTRGAVETFNALAGCRFAVDALSNGFALVARHVLEEAGVEVDYVEVGGVRERFDALVAGDADATLLGPPFGELAVQEGMRNLATVNGLLPDFPGQGLVVRAPLVDSEELHHYLRALARGAVYCDSLSADDGVAFLTQSGFSTAATAAWDARPETLEVSSPGLAMLTAIRRRLGMLPPGIELAALCDAGPLGRAKEAVAP